jgi:hypothetical protein
MQCRRHSLLLAVDKISQQLVARISKQNTGVFVK